MEADRTGFAHDAVLRMDAASDSGAPGAAITVALCGHWEHDPPCPLAPHHTRAERRGDELHLRVLFAADPAREREVRARIASALARGTLAGPDGGTSTWTLLEQRAGTVDSREAAHVARLAAS
jgi:hypothetical protein